MEHNLTQFEGLILYDDSTDCNEIVLRQKQTQDMIIIYRLLCLPNMPQMPRGHHG